MENNKPSGFFRRASDADTDRQNDSRYERSERSERSERPDRDDNNDGSSEDSRPPRRATPSRDFRNDDRPSFGRQGSGNRPSYGGRSSDRGSDRGDRPTWQNRGDSRTGGRSDRSGDRNDRPGGDRGGNNKAHEEREAPENVIFGIHPVREALEAGTQIEKIYFRREGYAPVNEQARREERWQRGDFRRENPRDSAPVNNAALDALRATATEAGIHIQEVPVEKLNRLTRNGNHQGVVAVVAAIEYKDINELIDQIIAAPVETPPLLIVMDSVTDIRNFGAIARSAECAGAMALIIPAKNSAPVNAEAIKSSAGALNLIPVSRVGSLKGTIARLKEIGVQCIAATEKSDSLIYEADFTLPTAIIMGAEDKGISRDILNLCDVQVSIPLLGRIESLNVSAAAAVMLFEASRQRFEKR